MSVTEFRPPDATADSLFLDRDGTLIVDGGYLYDPAAVTLLPGVREALRVWPGNLFLFTNQSGIGRGYFSWNDFWLCIEAMNTLLDLGGTPFVAICAAPEQPGETGGYRKPSPRFIEEMISKHGLDPARCWMVGDRGSDVRAGLAAGIHAVGLTETGKCELPESLTATEREEVLLFPDLPAFLGSRRD